jgi:hypothetical protein
VGAELSTLMAVIRDARVAEGASEITAHAPTHSASTTATGSATA